MGTWQYKKGLHNIGNGCWAWLLPDGGWGWSNAGLITDKDNSLLVDTLFDLPLTAEMLAAMRDVEPSAKEINTLVNTHSNGDHTFGNQLVRDSEIISSGACKEEMDARPPDVFVNRIKNWQNLGDAGSILWELMGRKFDFEGIEHTSPTRIFESELSLTVGDKIIHLTNVGPAHTKGDVLVHIPSEKIVYTGDIVFVGGHPVMWSGPVANWIKACDTILALDVETIVPGHGPISGKAEVRALQSYLVELTDQTRQRYDAGLDWVQASREIVADCFNHWIDRERVFINVNSLYREFGSDKKPPAAMKIFEEMAKWYWTEYPDRQPHKNCKGH